MDSNIIVEPLECLPCALNACDMFVVSKTLMDKVLEFIARDCKVPCHDRVSCLVALKLAFVHLVSQQIKFSQMQDKESKAMVTHVSTCENLASAWEKKYQAEHAIAESFGETAAALRRARSDLALAEKKLVEVEEVNKIMVEELEGLKRQSTRRMSKEQVEKMVWEAGFLIARMQLSRCFDLDFRDELFGNSSVSGGVASGSSGNRKRKVVAADDEDLVKLRGVVDDLLDTMIREERKTI